MIEKDDLHKYLVIVAGGAGSRMGSSLPKQFLSIGGRPVLMHAIDRFTEVFPEIEIIIVLPRGFEKRWSDLSLQNDFERTHHIAFGGDQRFDSVKNGLRMVTRQSLVAIHDAARPFVSADTISRCFNEAALNGNGIPAIHPPESLRQILPNGTSLALNRDMVKLIQTPQVFRSEILHKAYEAPFNPSFTDDATVVEASGERIHLVDGNPENIKITTPADLIIAEGILKWLRKNTR